MSWALRLRLGGKHFIHDGWTAILTRGSVALHFAILFGDEQQQDAGIDRLEHAAGSSLELVGDELRRIDPSDDLVLAVVDPAFAVDVPGEMRAGLVAKNVVAAHSADHGTGAGA
ncbi:MAG TPA: hypothetical protein VJN22_02935 [Candidatus Eremiobacteraceae bacterium]|nr:hypothetical protein [Candidatus Eremiobacteraceae bacterium]